MDDSRIEEILTDYIRHNLSPTFEERKNISEKYEELKSFLEGRTLQNGSYARFTSTTPVNDLDVIYILPESVSKAIAEATIDPNELDITDILGTLAKALRKAYPNNVDIKEQPHSVGIYFGSEDDFSIDVVPAVPAGEGLYWVPETAHLSIHNRRKLYESAPGINWIKSDPTGYIEQAKNTDKDSRGRFRKTAKTIKKWRIGCKNKNKIFPLKSFHLELLVTEIFKSESSLPCIDAVNKFFQELDDYMLEPKLRDRADNSRYIDEYLSDLSSEERHLIHTLREHAQSVLESMSAATTEAEILKALESLLGIDTPTSSSVSRSGTIVTSAVSKPYSIYS